ncbi:hypothetical protein B0A49_09240 [Cryomyces minteri]|uniref:Histone deacetylase domain-containing protein n=1 Tax=Cryomyces minteri TaxID=331657 RepID=A0A4U0WXK0_9PEZI|nr:hypothetical protein B0A49_09240 [Cryomyces minteri]
MEERPSITAASVAAEYFARELASHADAQTSADALVILHDSCYGHRYSRPKTTKSVLSMIVERPERIHASVLGLSTAYVRLGGRHAEGQSPPHPTRTLDQLPPFKIRKTSRHISVTSSVVTNVHGKEWMEELKVMCEAAEGKLASTGKELERPQENSDVSGSVEKPKFHDGDLYLCPESLAAFEGALGGVCDGVDAVFGDTGNNKSPTKTFVVIRPPGHHCSSSFPSGFCWLNNVHVGIEYAAQTYGLTHAAIIDFDLHHGDGSQSIAWERNAKSAKMPKNTPASKKTAIGYFSLHDINSYPCEYGDVEKVQNASLCIENAHAQSIWNVHLQPWKTEDEFWDLYETRYKVLIDKARAFLRSHTQRLRSAPNHAKPKAAIFLSAGFDASEWESQGMQRHKVNVPTEFYARFTRDVVKLAEEDGLGVDGRVISVLEGGYSDRALISGVFSHLSGLCGSQSLVKKEEPVEENGLAYEMGRRLGGLNLNGPSSIKRPNGTAYETRWWNADNLYALENLINPTPLAPARKPRNGFPPTYSSPTHSFSQKVVDPSKLYRTMSGTVRPLTQALTPPLPDVDWVTAAHELSKLLIPTDRQTKSCRPEDLAEPRVRKDRPSPANTLAEPAAGRMQLRDRRSKVPYVEPGSGDDAAPVRPVSRTNRRRTIAEVPLLSDDIVPMVPGPIDPRPRRRQSMASSVVSGSGEHLPPPKVKTAAAKAAPNSSSTASVPSTNGVQVKKTRAVGGAKVEKAKTKAAVKEPPMPSIPLAYINGTNAAQPPVQAPKGVETPPNDPTANQDDMAVLTSAVKRLTFKVPSREEHDRRQKALEEEKKKLAARTSTRKPAAPGKLAAGKRGASKDSPDAPVASGQIEPSAAPMPQSAQAMPTDAAAEAPTLAQEQNLIVPLAMLSHHDVEINEQPPEASPALGAFSLSSLTSPLPAEATTTMPPPSDTYPSVVQQPISPQTPDPTGLAFSAPNLDCAARQPLAKNTTTQAQASSATTPSLHGPTPLSPSRMRRGDLPVFTSSGVIPFGSAPHGNGVSTSMHLDAGPKEGFEAAEVDIWEVPDTPARR